MRAITWNRSFKGLGGDEGRDDFDMDSLETHATILDKLLAWEKKLFDEVKVLGNLLNLFLTCFLAQIISNSDA